MTKELKLSPAALELAKTVKVSSDPNEAFKQGVALGMEAYRLSIADIALKIEEGVKEAMKKTEEAQETVQKMQKSLLQIPWGW